MASFTEIGASQFGNKLDGNKIFQIKLNNADDLQKFGINPKDFGKAIMGQQMPEWFSQYAVPIGMGAESIMGLVGAGLQMHYQGKAINAQLDYMDFMKGIQRESLNAEITFKGDQLKAQKELTVLGYGTAERLAQIQSKKEVKLAEIASDTKKSLYNSQARQQLFLRTRFYGKPLATSGTSLV